MDRINILLVEDEVLIRQGLRALLEKEEFVKEICEAGNGKEFRQQLYTHYGTINLGTGWVSNTLFEPHVGDSIFKAMCKNEKAYL